MIKLVVKEAAERAGISNALELSQRAKLPYESCRRLWRGEATMVALTTLERICSLLRVPPGQLFDFEPEPIEADAGDRIRKSKSRATKSGKRAK
jgi:DNA-binding Xre family transcriptional regulator